MNKGQFQKGNVPYNKGMKRGSVSVDTEFKKGQVAHNFKGFGTPSVVGKRKEVITTINEPVKAVSRGKTYNTKRRTSYARYLWMQHHGDIPEGHVVYNNGPSDTITINNLEIISRAELVKRNKKQSHA